MRFERLPTTPSHATGTLLRTTPAPGTLGKPSRRLAMPVRQEHEEEEVEPISTPVRVEMNPAMLAEVSLTGGVTARADVAQAKRRRESLATPRALPLPPAGGFKSPVRDAKLSNLVATPSHPALATTSPEPIQHGVASTPINDLKHRLHNIRRRSVQRQEGRRVTVGFVLPATPTERPRFTQSASFTSAGPNTRRFVPHPPATPIVAPLPGSEVSSLAQTPTAVPMPTVSLHDILPQRVDHGQFDPSSSPPDNDMVDEIPEKVESASKINGSSATPRKRTPSTPSFAGFRAMMKQPAQAKTPYMTGIRELYPTTPKGDASPSLAGVKDLLRVAAVPATPSFVGVKGMFTKHTVPPTPAMDGIVDLYALDEEEIEEKEKVENEEEEEEQEEVEVAELSAIVVSVLSPVSKPSARSRTSRLASSTSSRSQGPIKSEAPTTEVAIAAKAQSRRGQAKSAAAVKETEQAPESKSKSSRARRVPEPAVVAVESAAQLKSSTSTSSRARRTTTEEPVSATVPPKAMSTSKSSRSSRTKAAEASQPVPEPSSSRSRSTASRSSRQAEVPPVLEEKEEEEKEVPKPKGRRKNILGDSDEQTAAPPPEPSSKITRGRKALASSTSDEPKSAPSRRTRTATADKENEAVEVIEPKVNKATKRTVAKKVSEPIVVATGTRATRSRK